MIRRTLHALLLLLLVTPPASAQNTGRPAGPPVVDLGGLAFTFNEGARPALPLQGRVANGVLDSVRVVEGAERLRLTIDADSVLHLSGVDEASGRFVLRFSASNADTAVHREASGFIRPVTDLRVGRLQSNETDTGRPGLLRVFTTDRRLLTELRADSTGRFDAVQLAENHDAYLLQAVITRDTARFGFVRTLEVRPPRPGEDVVVEALRAVPFDGLAERGIAPEAFRAHVLEVVGDRVQRWDLDTFNGLFIDTAGGSGALSEREGRAVRDALENTCRLDRLLGGHRVPFVLGGDAEVRVAYDWADRTAPFEPGWVVVTIAPSTPLAIAGQVEDRDHDGRFDRGAILLKNAAVREIEDWERLLCREAAYAFGMTGDATTIPFTHTLMTPGVGPQLPDGPTAVDVKTGHLLYEPLFAPGTHVDDVLGPRFLDDPVPPPEETPDDRPDDLPENG